MYKDVRKRIVAFLMLVCMFVTLVEWPTPVWAANSGTSYTYQNGDGTDAGVTLDADTVAAVFKTGQTEVLDRIQFDVHVEGGGTARATVSYYMDVKNGQPDSGTRVFEKVVDVRNGSNTLSTGLESQVMNGQSLFAIVISLEGADFYTFGGVKAGESYVRSGDAWKDMYTEYDGKCAAIRAYTYGRQAVGSAPAAGVQTYSDDSPKPIANVNDVELNKKKVTIKVGQTVMIQMVGFNNDREEQAKITWRTENALVATWSSPGTENDAVYIYGVDAGTTEIIATYEGQDYVCTVTVTKDDIDQSEIILDPESPVVYNGSTYWPKVTVTVDGETLEEGFNYDVGYQQKGEDGTWLNPRTVTPGKNGGAFIDADTYKVVVQAYGDGYGYTGSNSVDFVIEPKDIGDGSVRVQLVDVSDISSWESTLESNKDNQEELDQLIAGIWDDEVPAGGYARQKLELGKDYELEVKEDLTGIIVKGIGNYTGEQVVYTPRSIEGATIQFDAGDNYIYTGAPKEPKLSVKLSDGTTLAANDYVINYNVDGGNNIDAGSQVAVEVTGQGRFYGTVRAYYSILPKDINNLDYNDIEALVELSMTTPVNESWAAVSEAITLTYNKMTLKVCPEAQLGNATSYDYTLEIQLVDGTGTDDVPAQYRVIISGTWNGTKGNYTGSRSVDLTFGKDINDWIDSISVGGPYTYKGSAWEPHVTINWKNEDNVLTASDYVIEYVNNINARNKNDDNAPTVRIRGIGEYGGIITAYFTINPLKLSDPSVSIMFVDEKTGEPVDESSFSGLTYSPDNTEIEPELVITFKGENEEDIPVILDVDYSAKYEVESIPDGDVKVGRRWVEVTGIRVIPEGETAYVGNFDDSDKLYYYINACPLDSSAITAVLDQEVYNYTGTQITKPILTITHRAKSGKQYVLVEGNDKDYTVTYSGDAEDTGQIEIGDYTVTADAVSGGNYTSSVTKTYKITAIDISTVVRKDKDYFVIDSDNNAKDYVGPYFALLWYDRKDADNNMLQFTLKDQTGRELVPDTDYTVVWSNYDHMSSRNDVATVTITGKGKYYNSVTISYLLAEDLSEYHVSIKWTDSEGNAKGYENRPLRYRTYTGVPFVLTGDDVRVESAGTQLSREALEFGEDYTISYLDSHRDENLREALNASVVTATDGDGNTTAAIDPIVYIEDIPDAMLPTANGCFRYRDQEDDGTDKDEHKNSTTFRIERQDIAERPPVDYDPFEVDYTGDKLEPANKIRIHHTTVELNFSRTLIEGTDYTIREWGNNELPGPTEDPLAFAKVVGIGNYKGTLTVEFRVVGKSLGDIISWTMDPDHTTYNGTYLTPDIVELVLPGKLYSWSERLSALGASPTEAQVQEAWEKFLAEIKSEVCTWTTRSYSNNLNASTPNSRAVLKVVGRGVYAGSERELEFDILPRELQYTNPDKLGYIDVVGLRANEIYQSVQITPEPTSVACFLRTVDVADDDDESDGRFMQPLIRGTDYELTYDTNLNVADSPDHSAVILTGIGNYTGTYRETFKILPKQLWVSQAEDLDNLEYPDNLKYPDDLDNWVFVDEVELAPGISVAEIDSQAWTGIEVRPVPVITYTNDSGETYVLQAGTDFECKYLNNGGTGNASVVVIGRENFADLDTKEPWTNIIRIPFSIGLSIEDSSQFRVTYPDLEDTVYTYDGYPKEPAVVVETLQNSQDWVRLELGKDYTIVYADPLGSEDGAVNAGTARIIVKGMGNYAGRVEKEFTILPKNLNDEDITFTVDVPDGGAGYTGKEVTPGVTLTYNGLNPAVVGAPNLSKDRDYSVSYSDGRTEIGTVTVTVTGNGNYTGERSTTFEIVKAEIGTTRYEPNDNFRVEGIPPQPLIEGKAEPVPVLTYNWEPLRPGIDYSWTYENNTRVGTATVIIHGEGNYTGSIRKDFEIVEGSTDITVELPFDMVVFEDYVTKEDREYFEANKTLPDDFGITFDDQIVVTNSRGETLELGTDYTVEYVHNDWIGTMEVNIVGTGTKMVGTVQKTVTVTMTLPASDAVTVPGFSLEIPPVMYTGNPVNASPVMTYYGRRMTYTHYNISCYNNTEIGNEAEIWIIGREENGVYGIYQGTYTIYPNTQAFEVSGIDASYKYKGAPWKPIPTTVYYNNQLLVKDVDYELKYDENIDAGVDAGAVYIIGRGSYDGLTTPVYFTIEPWDIANLDIILTPSSTTYTGAAIEPEVTLQATINSVKYPLQETDFTANYSDNINAGRGTVTVTGQGGNVTGTGQATFLIGTKSLAVPAAGTGEDLIRVEVNPSSYPYDGTPKMPEVSVYYRYGAGENQERKLTPETDYTVKYSNNVNAGTATVRVTGDGNYSGYRDAYFTITEQDFSEDNVSVVFTNGPSYPYMGSGVEIKPAMTVTLNGKPLTAGQDYSVAYEDNTSVGTATVIITGKGSFAGEIKRQFEIIRHNIAADDIVVQPIPNQAFTGSAITPEVVITCGTYTLVRGTDYETSILSDNVQPGEVRMLITGIDGFTGARETTFKIASDISGADVEGFPATRPYTGSAYSAADLVLGMVVSIQGSSGKITLRYPTDFTAALAPGSDGESAGEQKLILTGTGNYGGKRELTFRIEPHDINDGVTMTGFVDNITNSADYKQNIKLRWGNIELKEGIDYEVAYEQAGATRHWTMTVMGRGNYTGSFTREYTMETVDISSATITLLDVPCTYDGSYLEPEVVVQLGSTTLQRDVHYTVSYENNRDAGVATVRVKGIGYYNGEVTLTFQIQGRSIALASVSPDPIPTQVYTGKDVEPAVKVTYSNMTLEEKTDYTLRYANNRKANDGTGTITIVGRGNYSATKTVTFALKPYTVTRPAVTSRTTNTIEISWTLGGTATGYEIQRRTNGGDWEQTALVGARITSYKDQSLSANTTYEYRIRAYVVVDTNTYYGEWSNSISGTTTK